MSRLSINSGSLNLLEPSGPVQACREIASDFTHQPMKMEPIEGFETSAIINQTPGNYPKENLLDWYLFTDISEQAVGSHFKGQQAKKNQP